MAVKERDDDSRTLCRVQSSEMAALYRYRDSDVLNLSKSCQKRKLKNTAGTQQKAMGTKHTVSAFSPPLGRK